MKPLWVLISREFTTRIAKKGFWFFTIFLVAIMIVLTYMPTIQHYIEQKSMTTVVVNDSQGVISSQLNKIANEPDAPYSFRVITTSQSGLQNWNQAQTIGFMNNLHTKLVVDVSRSANEQVHFTIEKNGTFDDSTISSLEGLLKESVTEARLSTIPLDIIKRVSAPVSFSTHQLQTDAKSGEHFTQSKMLVYFLVILLFTSLISFGAWVAQGVIEEKSNRIVEMMLIAVKPWHILFGKVIGIGFLGMIQCILLLTTMAASLHFQHNQTLVSVQGISMSTILFFPVFFIIGYFIYATMFGISGSLVNRAEDQQMAITPITLILVVFFYGSLFGLINPSSTFTVILSFIPFEPMAMFTRIALTSVPAWQIALGIVEEILLVVALIYVGAKIYRRFALHSAGRGGFRLLFPQNRKSDGVHADS